MIKKSIITLLVIGFTIISYRFWQTNQIKPAPEISLITISGKKIELAQLKGKPVIVSFWATRKATDLHGWSRINTQRPRVLSPFLSVNIRVHPWLDNLQKSHGFTRMVTDQYTKTASTVSFFICENSCSSVARKSAEKPRNYTDDPTKIGCLVFQCVGVWVVVFYLWTSVFIRG